MFSDRLAKPSAGRYFPLTAGELVSRVTALSFSAHGERLRVFTENAAAVCDRGYQLCAFNRMRYLAAFSLPELVPVPLGRKAMEVAIQTMAEIDRGPRLNVRPQQFVMYRAFLGPVGELTITRQLISARSRSYLWHDRVSQLSNAERDTRGHTELYLEQLGE